MGGGVIKLFQYKWPVWVSKVQISVQPRSYPHTHTPTQHLNNDILIITYQYTGIEWKVSMSRVQEKKKLRKSFNIWS